MNQFKHMKGESEFILFSLVLQYIPHHYKVIGVLTLQLQSTFSLSQSGIYVPVILPFGIYLIHFSVAY